MIAVACSNDCFCGLRTARFGFVSQPRPASFEYEKLKGCPVVRPDELADTLRDLHIQYVVFQTRYYENLASVKVLEAAFDLGKFSQEERIPMIANYGKRYMADLTAYRPNAEFSRGRVAPSMQIKLLGRSF